MSSFSTFFKKISGTDKSIQFRMLNALVIVGAVCAFISCVSSLVFSFPIKSTLLSALCVFDCLITWVIINFFKRPYFANAYINISINLVLFPLMYFCSGGIESGMPVWLLMGLLLAFATTPGTKRTIITFCISAIGPVTTVILGYLHPEWITPMDSDLDIVIDVIQAVLLVAIMFGVMYKIQASAYEKQQKQIEISAKTAIAATKAKSDFLSNMTHDIRTPMNAIIGFTEIARKNLEHRTTLLESLSNISTASEHLLALVNDVLDMASIENGKFELQCEPTTLTDIIEKVETIMTPEMEDINLHFIVDTSEIEEDSISCDVLRLTQILINVLGNSVKYSHPDGHVYLSVSQRQNQAEDKIICEIRIRDEGIGIGADFIPHVFEPFTREKTTTVSGIPGSGLGLSITKTMVEMMGGTISVTSEQGKGTEFFIRIPFDIPALVEIGNNEDLSKYRFDGKRVLVVEDNELNCDIVQDLLIEAGFEVDVASDGTYAIEKVRVSAPGYYDIILMDIQMPLMNGFESTEIIRSFDNDTLANIPIVALSANAFETDRIKAEACGMNGFIIKPINGLDMLKTLKRVLAQ